ncbi:replication protein A 70 kDa DNA-binding subunit B-like [Coffea eugenioides]|uniref:replication protein A 70 kDa DNA-binding subunit B-like n=1 Tax=Coffea eugenioides TaxID=49369 RepID=UPI000F610BF0|nr:replication protein A 70 kDa DNA-binding subunit B-like [Coffea eugenioides]
MVLTLWGEHESEERQDIADMIHTQPVVAALRVRVTSYHAMHLSTKFSSSILINPPIQQANDLRNWCSHNQEEIARFIAERTYADRLKLLPVPDDDRVITSSDLTAVVEARPYWIRGIPKLLDRSQKLWYHSCPHCYKYIRARPDCEITCTSCYQRIRLTPRCRLTVQISDMSGAITLDLSGDDAEQLLPFCISDIQKQEQQGNVQYATIADFIKQKNLVCLVKKSNTIHSSRSSEKYNAIVAHINNATAEENYVISKYITNYKATASTWGAAQEEHSKKNVTNMAENIGSIMEGETQSKGVDQLSPSNTEDKKKKAAVAAAPMKLRVNPTKKHRT